MSPELAGGFLTTALPGKSHIHSFVDGHVGPFHLLAVVTSASVNMCVSAFVWVSVLGSLGCIPRSGIAESYGNSVLHFFRN